MTVRPAPVACSLTARFSDIDISGSEPPNILDFNIYTAQQSMQRCAGSNRPDGGCYATERGGGLSSFRGCTEHLCSSLRFVQKSQQNGKLKTGATWWCLAPNRPVLLMLVVHRRRSSRLPDVFLVSSFDSPHVLHVTLAPQ